MRQQHNQLPVLGGHDLGIDLGTANTRIAISGRGIVINEPSVIAIDKRTGAVKAVGGEARAMIGKAPPDTVVVRPLKGGVISDFDAVANMLAFLIKKAQSSAFRAVAPRPQVMPPLG